MIVPTSFAADSSAACDVTVENITLTAGTTGVRTADYYFDSNAPDDSGDGSISNPYKEFKSSRIADNSNLHLANGEYSLDRSAYINNVNIIGSDSSQTIIKYYGTGFTVSSSLTLKDVTLVNLRITNNGNLTATNTIFKDYQSDSAKGGVIQSEKTDAKTILDHCTFNNTSANYGGAIYLSQACLTVTDTVFANSHSNLYGGVIVGDDKSDINIRDSKFLDSYSAEDAGGAIYLWNSEMIASNLEISNCSSTFGGAITSLMSTLKLDNFTGKNNRAKYDGGAIYALYHIFRMSDSLFESNFAQNAGAVYVYHVDDLIINTTSFIRNEASDIAGAYYSVYLNEPYYDSILDPELHNTFSANKAKSYNDLLEADLPDMFIGSNDFELIYADVKDVSKIPSKYDLRELNQVSSVKNQGKDGNCWAFSTLGALESSIMKATGIELDLSEENMKDIMGFYSPYGWMMETNVGGYDKMGYGYLVGWFGPVNESDDEYKTDVVLSPVLNALIHVQNVLFFNRSSYTDNDDIKLAIMKYGGVSTSLYTTHEKYQYYTGSSGANHAAVIVGWDDALEFKGAPGKGGWIVKNSWGSSFGDKGYFYVSYYDTKFAEPGKLASYAFVLEDSIKYDKNYQYDLPGRTDYFINSSNVAWYKNRFTATDKEYLAAVSTFFEKDTNWELSVYVNNKLKLTQSGFSSSAYRTIELNQMVPLSKGDVFEIIFKISVDAEAGVPVSEIVSLNTKFYNEGISYLSYDGKNWMDLNNLSWEYGTHIYNSQVACIKAFTVFDMVKTSMELKVMSDYNPFEFKAIVKNQYGNPVNSGKVTFSVEGKTVTAEVINGVADLTYSFAREGIQTVTAKFSATGYYDSSASTQVDVRKLSTQMATSDVTCDYNSGKGIVATLTNEKGKAVGGVEVRINIGGKTHILTTDENGQVALTTNGMVPDSYTATITFQGNDVYTGSRAIAVVKINKVNSELTSEDVTCYYNDGKSISATLKDLNGNAVSGTKVKIAVGGKTETLTTDSNGQVSMSLDGIVPNSYFADISFAGNSIYNPSSTAAKVTINKVASSLSVSDVTCYYNEGKDIVAILKDANGNAISDAQVKIAVGSIERTLTTDADGQVALTTAGLDPDKYTATVTFNGNDCYINSGASATVTIIQKEKSKIFLRNALYFALETKIVQVTLWDANNKPLANKTVHIAVYDSRYSGVTDENGDAYIRVGVGFGVHNATVSFDGDYQYDGAVRTGNIRVIKETPSVMIRGADSQFKVRDNPKIVKVYLWDRTSKPLPVNSKIAIKVNGQTFIGYTDSQGIASIKVTNINYAGTFNAQAVYGGNSAYNAVTRNFKITVK